MKSWTTLNGDKESASTSPKETADAEGPSVCDIGVNTDAILKVDKGTSCDVHVQSEDSDDGFPARQVLI